ncbi:MAG: AEC family transporter [Xanthobacteraceae bacterium]|nr:MAG: AEC family transporter [Xanthobacteraceae bacterium]
MAEVLALAFPYFGLILIGFACGKARGLPEAGLAWMNFFLLYVALPALFFRIMAKTPFEQLNNPPFILATTLATAFTYGIGALTGRFMERTETTAAAITGLAAGYGNIGYMGPGLALVAIGAQAAVPVALIFCFDSIFLFSITPLMIALTDPRHSRLWPTAFLVMRQIAFNPLILASFAGAFVAAVRLPTPDVIDRMLEFLQNAAAPVALFALGVTVALRPFGRVLQAVPVTIAIKLLAHPLIVLGMLALFGPFDAAWSATALMMASLPPALNVFILARQYDSWIEGASAAVLLGTLTSVVTLTVTLWLIRSGQIAWF